MANLKEGIHVRSKHFWTAALESFLKRTSTNLRLKILSLYAGVVILLSLSVGYSLEQSWDSIVKRLLDGLIRDACTVSSLMQDSLLDFSKLLETTKSQMEKEASAGSIEQHRAHEILCASIRNFSIYKSTDLLGLLLYLDQNGQLIARSKDYPLHTLDFSKSYFYRDIKENPGKKFTISHLIKAETTGRMVFHLAMPIRNESGGFAGIVVQQIDEHELAGTLHNMLGDSPSRILVQIPNGKTVFHFPLAGSTSDPWVMTNQQLIVKIMAQKKRRGWARFLAENNGASEVIYLGFEYDPIFGLYTSAAMPEKMIRSVFLIQNRHLIVVFLLSILAISFLFLRLYRQALNLELALREATTDHITGINNRRALESQFERLLRDAERKNKPISTLFMDIDHFKPFNDNYGHDAGDEVLKAVAKCIRNAARRPLDLFCRWGGEEFVAILPDTTEEAALLVANHIMENVHKIELRKRGKPLPGITISIGIATSLLNGEDHPEEMIERADKALLRAKVEGRDRVVIA